MISNEPTTRRSSPAFAIGGPGPAPLRPFVALPSATVEQCRRLTERVLAAQGDRAEPELIRLQHILTSAVSPHEKAS